MLNGNKWQVAVITISLLLCAVALPAWAQLDTGSIVGVVRDNSGAVVSGADVKVTSTKTGRVNEVKAGSAGEYEVSGLPAGPYQVEVSHTGFKVGVVSGIVLHATDTRSADVVLSIGSAAERVTVTADITTVNTQTSETGATIDANKVANLPLNGRDFTSLMALVPGSVTTAGFGGTSLGGFETSLAGVNILLDGTDATRIDSQATSSQLGRQASRISRASVDSIEEFSVMSSTYSAEYGRSYGDIVNVITKSGGNNYHGGVFEFFRNDAFDVLNYFATEKTPLHLNQFGGNLGGPIAKDRLFFFVNYEGVRQIVNNPTGPVAVMTQATKDTAVASIAPVLAAIPDPNTSIPVIFPNPTPGGPPILRTDLGYFEGKLLNTIREDTGSVKLDYNASSRNTFNFRFNIADSFTSTQYGIALDQTSPSPSRNYLAKATWNHTFRPNLMNEFGVAFNRPQTASLGGGGNFPIFQCVFCDGTNTFGTAPGPALFSDSRPQHSLQFIDTLSWVKGKHAIHTGLDIRRVVTHDTLAPQDFLGYAGEVGNLLSNNGFSLSTLGYNEVGLQNVNYGFFVQDDFRILPRLTLNLGVRYEYNSVLHGSDIQNFNLPALLANPTSTDTAQFFYPLGAGLYKPDRNNFAPRIGFAWDPFGTAKTVVRGGFGIFYNAQLTGEALSLAGNAQQNFSINVFDFFFGFTCTPPLTIAYPVPSPLPVCTPALPPNVNSLDPNLRDSYSMHWSLGVQQEIVHNTVLELSYVANRGVKLPAGAAYAGQELNLSPFFGAPNEISPFFGQVRHLGDYVESSYQSLQASLRRRIGRGLNIDANYTLAHEFDDGVNILVGAYQNSRNPKGDYANGDIDVRNNFTLGAVYDVPTAEFLPKLLGRGWQLTTLIQARSGLPFNIADAAPFFGEDQIRPNYVAGQPVRPANYSVPGNQLNAFAFAVPPAGQDGNVGRNAGRGPGFTQIDIGLSKRTQINERLGLQLGAQAFNLMNHPNFSNPDGLLSDSTFGQSTSTIGNLVGTGTSRQIQLLMKFIF